MSLIPAQVVVTDLHRRMTGVSATIRNLVHHQRHEFNLKVWAKLPIDGFEHFTTSKLYKLLKQRPSDKPFHICHVRRNNEMQWALFFKHVLRCPIRIVFTSAAIRRHSAWPRWLISKMDRVIATSDKAASFLENVSAVVHHGVDIQKFTPATSREDALKQLGLPFEYAIGQFGRVRPEKGVDYFVEAMIKLLPKYPEFGAVLVGKVTAKFERFSADLQAKVKAAGLEDRIIWLGEVSFDRIPAVYNAMSFVVAPSRYEGFGLTPLEAMATGAPVIAADTGAYAAMIEPGTNGYIFPVDDTNMFQQHLETLMSDPLSIRQMSDDCQLRVSEHFSIQSEVQGISDVYHQLWDAES
ncbi:MAG: glycosyltransferase family 4 protein [Planctomycetota bacterium]|nr:glycosyltransferase family 4 protein [Planctomycetota bacterium]